MLLLRRTLQHWSMYIQRDLPIPPALREWQSQGLPKVSLDAAGLVALADLTTVAQRTALTGTSALLDALVLCPGLHRQQHASELNNGEYPACAAMTTGYVFRVENPATVHFLQKVGRTGHLTTLSVTITDSNAGMLQAMMSCVFEHRGSPLSSAVLYLLAVALTLAVISLLSMMRDWWAVSVIGLLIFARILNVIVVRRRAVPGWFGASEPGVKGDLLILLSQDRWVRIQGYTDDLKAVTSGQWLRDSTFLESLMTALATLLVYLDAALARNARQEGKILLLVLLFGSAALLGLANECAALVQVLRMHGRLISVVGKPKKYPRRLDLAKELIKEMKGGKWAVSMGMVQSHQVNDILAEDAGPVTM